MPAQERIIPIEGINYYTLHTTPTHTPNNKLVLLSHALMANHTMWTRATAALISTGYTTLAYDHIGHNNTPAPQSYTSSPDDPAYHFDTLTRHMRELVRAVTGQTKVYAVIGCSMGGVLALRYAMLYPSDVSVVLSCDPPGLTSLPAAKPLWGQRIRQFEADVADGDDSLCRATAERWVPGSDAESVGAREEVLGMVRTCGIDGYRICADGIRGYDYVEALGGVRARCMVLVGSEDGAVGPRSVLEDVAGRIGGCEFVWLEGAGHVPPVHRGREFNRVMLEFLGKG